MRPTFKVIKLGELEPLTDTVMTRRSLSRGEKP